MKSLGAKVSRNKEQRIEPSVLSSIAQGSNNNESDRGCLNSHHIFVTWSQPKAWRPFLLLSAGTLHPGQPVPLGTEKPSADACLSAASTPVLPLLQVLFPPAAAKQALVARGGHFHSAPCTPSRAFVLSLLPSRVTRDSGTRSSLTFGPQRLTPSGIQEMTE